MVDAVVATVYCNTIFKGASTIPSHASKQVEDHKFKAGHVSTKPISSIHGGPHVLVPFAMENGGRLGAHALALLRALVVVVLDKERHSSFAYRSSGSSVPTLVSFWVQR